MCPRSMMRLETKNAVQVRRSREQLDHLAWLMDECFRVPGLNWRFGLDSIVGLVPGLGDIVGGVVGLFLLFRALQFRLPPVVIARMVLNSLIDILAGSIPVLGDLFDFAWKSNSKNMRLFHRHAGEPGRSTLRHWLFIGGLFFVFLLLFFLLAVAVIYSIRLLTGHGTL
jgi:hypothetical protein